MYDLFVGMQRRSDLQDVAFARDGVIKDGIHEDGDEQTRDEAPHDGEGLLRVGADAGGKRRGQQAEAGD
ncbi:MAG TPA: hypothetical protein VLZ50_10805 [Terracidiphilus sp.]|nr:hypothetical protein [Terracidiphilus sp.]